MHPKAPLALIFAPSNYNEISENGQTLRVKTIKRILISAGYQVMTIQIRRGRFIKAYKIIKRVEPDLVTVTSFIMAPIIFLIPTLSVPLWLDIMDSAVSTRSKKNLLKWVYFCFFESFMLKRGIKEALFVSFISRTDKEKDSKFTKGKSVFVVPNTVESQKVKPYFRAEIKRIVHVGDLTYKPNLRAAKQLLRVGKYLPFDLKFYGKSSKWISRRVKSEYSNQFLDMYRKGDLHVCLTDSEPGVKNKVVNALIAGIPVITTRKGLTGLKPSLGIAVIPNGKLNADQLIRAVGSLQIPDETVIWNGYDMDETELMVRHLNKLCSP